VKKQPFIILFSIVILLGYSCSTPKYFHNEQSYKRQKELQNSRSSNVFTDITLGILSVASAAAFETEVVWYPTEQRFKKLNLINPTTDTIYINMLTDVLWDEFDYCDFMDIRIPPKMDCKVLVPTDASYNLYFSNTPESDDDEMLEIYTSDISKLTLYPGITATNNKISK